jgi:hypothetical protein
MPTASRERVKLYMVIGLSVFFVAVGYFRFFHGKVALPVEPPSRAGVQVPVPAIDVKDLQPAVKALNEVPGPPRTKLRDIFEPRKQMSTEAQRLAVPAEPPKPLPSLKLTGTIVGGRNPLAFINGRTLQLGEKIEGFQVISITREQVTLTGEGRKMLLNVLEGTKGETGI